MLYIYIFFQKNHFGNYVMNEIFMWGRRQKEQKETDLQGRFCDVQARDDNDLTQNSGKGDKKKWTEQGQGGYYLPKD